jgi:uncharacterized protein YxeA
MKKYRSIIFGFISVMVIVAVSFALTYFQGSYKTSNTFVKHTTKSKKFYHYRYQKTLIEGKDTIVNYIDSIVLK